MASSFVVLIKSCRQYRNRREACDITWASELRRGAVPVFYTEGGYENPTLTNLRYGGLIGTVTGDSKECNTVKLRDAIRSLLMWAPGWERLFICDDDTFVHASRLLLHEPADGLECRLYKPVTTQERRLNKGQPWIHGGGGWWMPRRLCELYVEGCRDPRTWDDVLVAKIAQANGVQIINRPDLYGADRYTKQNDRVGLNNALITCHHVEPAEMLSLYHEHLSDSLLPRIERGTA